MRKSFKIVDTHCHLDDTLFSLDIDDVIQRALSSDVHMITSAISKDTWQRGFCITSKYDSISLSLGLDPILSSQAIKAEELIKINRQKLVSIGEVGLDHYRERDHKKREEQEKVFRDMIALSKELRLPIQVHSRSAGRIALEILSEMNAEKVHMHAFDGKASLARVASREQGYYFSIPTSVVRSQQKRKLVKAVDVERILVETDSPVLGPEKGVRNEPLNVWISLKEVALILGRELEEMREIILENTLRLYTKI
jgi:TatD DNase family protein